ncbi:UDP-N-acetylmuramate dehydrogenase [Aliifodinibius salicampi]|uniref:UDP-N-acetylenolpyruvoylglucosamine reductase n=1 Tax=Fodinibius salicampi TaxID=1920655 RepID=A0ABT3PUR8_9BACT|nr:UDP-N-acetylmuramate dehydrogenase [Fodinibius salicampi]MCW9711591.1 UDP-N-acetylmuramate dehydrogenase [Fodinibius salicampi]
MPESLNKIVNQDVQLRPYNTLDIPARARLFASITSVEELQQLLQESPVDTDDMLVLGGGSNILFAGDFPGMVLQIAIKGKKIVEEDDSFVWLEIGGGENWHQTVRYAIDKGWGGIENLSLIPGTVGAAPIQNIGAYGAELADVFERLEAVNIASAEVRTFSKEECEFGYRDSIFKRALKGKFAITKIVLKLSKRPEINSSYGAIQSELERRNINEPTIRDISDIVISIRNDKLPNPEALGNAGSFFKNPIVEAEKFEKLKQSYPQIPGYEISENEIKVPAGWLIEEAGWKGKKIGNTGTYRQQALVIVNHGGATAEEILNLAAKIQESVREKFEIDLVPEVNIIS